MLPFKAKLIADQRYYQLYSRCIQWSQLSALLLWVILTFVLPFQSLTLTLAIGLLILLVPILVKRLFLGVMSRLIGENYLEADTQEIRLLTPDRSINETIPLDEVDKIIVKKAYGFPGETMREAITMFFGKTKENYLIVQQGTHPRRIDFFISSYLMQGRLRKLIEDWTQNGRPVEQI